MKKGKVFGKGQIAVFVMVLALAAAVWLNVKYSGNTKYLGDLTYVGKSGEKSKTVETSAKVKETEDYFQTAIKERDSAYDKAEETVEEALKSSGLSDNEKQSALENLNKLANRIATAQNIESLLKAKGFKKAVAVISDESINIVVSGEGLTTEQTLQIQDIVTQTTDISIANIKIITVK